MLFTTQERAMEQRKFVTNGWLVPILATGVILTSESARADEIVERRVVREDVGTIREETRPNKGLITSGVVLLGATYVASLVVATTTSDYGPDRKLYVPVAGPWLDLADRKGECGRPGGPSCDNEDLYQVLLVADGIGQGIGALQIVGGFLFPVHRTVTTAKWTVVPRLSPNMIGLSAVGTF